MGSRAASHLHTCGYASGNIHLTSRYTLTCPCVQRRFQYPHTPEKCTGVRVLVMLTGNHLLRIYFFSDTAMHLTGFNSLIVHNTMRRVQFSPPFYR